MAPRLAWGSRPRPEVYPFSKALCTGCALPPPPPVGSYSRAVVSARPHLLLGLALFAASFTLALVFAATGRAEATTLTPDVGIATATDGAGAVPTLTVDGSPAADGTSGPTTDPAPAPPTDAVPPPTDAVPPPTDAVPPPTDAVPPPTDAVPPPTDAVPPPTDAVPPPTDAVPPPTDAVPPPTDAVPPPTDAVPPPTDAVPPPTDAVPPPTDAVPPPTDAVPPPTDAVPPPTDAVPPPTDSPHDPLGVLGPSLEGVPVATPGPGSDALVAIVFGSPGSSAPPVNERSGGVAAAPGHSRGAPGQPWLPTDSPGPSAPASAPAGSGGAPGGGFFFSGFAALVAAACFGLAGRSTKRLITSVVAWEPVAFVSLPERPG